MQKKEQFEDVISRRNHGRTHHYDYDRLGYNYRMTDIFASILLENLKCINEDNKMRVNQANFYANELRKLGINFIEQGKFGQTVYHQFVILNASRNLIKIRLRDRGVTTAIVYPIPLSKTEIFKSTKFFSTGNISDKIARECLSLPLGGHLSSEDLEYIVHSLANSCDES